jgi:hypothetical protein
MTEAECLACEDPNAMMSWLAPRDASRKLRLFACACCRRVTKAEDAQQLVELSEKYADNEGVTKGQLKQLRRQCRTAHPLYSDQWEMVQAVKHAAAVRMDASHGWYDGTSALSAAHHAAHTRLPPEKRHQYDRFSTDPDWRDECHSQAELVRDIFGNPFRPAAFAPEWRTDTAVSLAEQMYGSRDFGAMPILADALQDAGCDTGDILHHCRGEGLHVRGCWVVDLVLGKE